MINLIAMPYLPKGQIVKRGRPSSTKGSIGCVSIVYQLLIEEIIIILKNILNYFISIVG